jgi:hypothetical protein
MRLENTPATRTANVSKPLAEAGAAPAGSASQPAVAPPPNSDEKAFARLRPDDQKAYVTAWNASAPEGRGRLTAMLASGQMSAPDSTGKTLAANLGAIANLKPPAGAPYTGATILDQTIAHLADPEVIDQSNRNTCGATTIQYLLASTQPSEYARLVAGIAGPGSVKSQKGGGTLERVADSVAKDDTTRDDVERLMQSALQDYGTDPRGRYSNATDDFKLGERSGDGWLSKLTRWASTPVNASVQGLGATQGISEGKVHSLYQDVLGKPARLVGDWPGGQLLLPVDQREDVYDQVMDAVHAGRQVPVDIILKDLHDKPGEQREVLVDQHTMDYTEMMASHQVLVTKVEAGRVYYRNPWGYQTSMSEAEFKSRLTDGIIPA